MDKKIFVFAFLLGLLMISGFAIANSGQLEPSSKFFDFDKNSDGVFSQNDIDYWVGGYKHQVLNAKNLLYIVDKIPQDGIYSCDESDIEACLKMPLYTNNKDAAQARSLFILNAFETTPALRVFSQNSFNKLSPSKKEFSVTGSAVNNVVTQVEPAKTSTFSDSIVKGNLRGITGSFSLKGNPGYRPPPPKPECGNGQCEDGESVGSCASDCTPTIPPIILPVLCERVICPAYSIPNNPNLVCTIVPTYGGCCTGLYCVNTNTEVDEPPINDEDLDDNDVPDDFPEVNDDDIVEIACETGIGAEIAIQDDESSSPQVMPSQGVPTSVGSSGGGTGSENSPQVMPSQPGVPSSNNPNNLQRELLESVQARQDFLDNAYAQGLNPAYIANVDSRMLAEIDKKQQAIMQQGATGSAVKGVTGNVVDNAGITGNSISNAGITGSAVVGICGDGVINLGESCDYGLQNGNVCNPNPTLGSSCSYCSSSCVSEYVVYNCGDGICNYGETYSSCSSDCTNPSITDSDGDGIFNDVDNDDDNDGINDGEDTNDLDGGDLSVNADDENTNQDYNLNLDPNKQNEECLVGDEVVEPVECKAISCAMPPISVTSQYTDAICVRNPLQLDSDGCPVCGDITCEDGTVIPPEVVVPTCDTLIQCRPAMAECSYPSQIYDEEGCMAGCGPMVCQNGTVINETLIISYKWQLIDIAGASPTANVNPNVGTFYEFGETANIHLEGMFAQSNLQQPSSSSLTGSAVAGITGNQVSAVCGDNSCDAGEDATNCASDCSGNICVSGNIVIVLPTTAVDGQIVTYTDPNGVTITFIARVVATTTVTTTTTPPPTTGSGDVCGDGQCTGNENLFACSQTPINAGAGGGQVCNQVCAVDCGGTTTTTGGVVCPVAPSCPALQPGCSYPNPTRDANNCLIGCGSQVCTTPPPAPVCGDGVVDAPETCDNGNTNGLTCTISAGQSYCDYCTTSCNIIRNTAVTPPLNPTTPSVCTPATNGCTVCVQGDGSGFNEDCIAQGGTPSCSGGDCNCLNVPGCQFMNGGVFPGVNSIGQSYGTPQCGNRCVLGSSSTVTVGTITTSSPPVSVSLPTSIILSSLPSDAQQIVCGSPSIGINGAYLGNYPVGRYVIKLTYQANSYPRDSSLAILSGATKLNPIVAAQRVDIPVYSKQAASYVLSFSHPGGKIDYTYQPVFSIADQTGSTAPSICLYSLPSGSVTGNSISGNAVKSEITGNAVAGITGNAIGITGNAIGIIGGIVVDSPYLSNYYIAEPVEIRATTNAVGARIYEYPGTSIEYEVFGNNWRVGGQVWNDKPANDPSRANLVGNYDLNTGVITIPFPNLPGKGTYSVIVSMTRLYNGQYVKTPAINQVTFTYDPITLNDIQPRQGQIVPTLPIPVSVQLSSDVSIYSHSVKFSLDNGKINSTMTRKTLNLYEGTINQISRTGTIPITIFVDMDSGPNAIGKKAFQSSFNYNPSSVTDIVPLPDDGSGGGSGGSNVNIGECVALGGRWDTTLGTVGGCVIGAGSSSGGGSVTIGSGGGSVSIGTAPVCTLGNANCGNGLKEPGEICDAGSSNGQVCNPNYGGSCTYCTASCTSVTVDGAMCGDGIVQTNVVQQTGGGIDEQCDLGSQNGLIGPGTDYCQYCSNSCVCVTNSIGPYCGDYQCNNGESYLSCPSDCTNVPSVCGNNVVETGETCDDGTANNGIVCNPNYNFASSQLCNYCTGSCTQGSVLGPFCGDTICTAGQETQTSCAIDCTPTGAVCGNGAIENPEVCDAGSQNGVSCTPLYNAASSQLCNYCTGSCTQGSVPGPFCGDTICTANYEDATSCPGDCGTADCGNGVLNLPGEACDAGPNGEPVCVPGYSTSGSALTCSYCTSSCSLVPVSGPFCGDGVCSATDGENVNNCGAPTGDCQQDITPPTCPTTSNVVTGSVNQTSATLTWVGGADEPQGSGFAGVLLYRFNTFGQTNSVTTATPETYFVSSPQISFVDNIGLTAGNSYYYRFGVKDNVGNVAICDPSLTLTATTLTAPVVIPFTVTIDSPTAGQVINTSTVNFIVSLSQLGGSVNYSLNNGLNNLSMSGTGQVFSSSNTGMTNSLYTLTVYAQNASGAKLTATRQFSVAIASSITGVSIDLAKGYNYFSVPESTTAVVGSGIGSSGIASLGAGPDKELDLNPNWNLVGYSGTNDVPQTSLEFKGSDGNYKNLNNAAREKRIQKRLVEYSADGQKFVYSTDTTAEEGKTYWVYARETGKLKAPSVGTPTTQGIPVKVRDIQFQNITSGEIKTLENATSARWVGLTGQNKDSLINYWSPTGYRTVISTQDLETWKGYYVWSNTRDIRMIVPNA